MAWVVLHADHEEAVEEIENSKSDRVLAILGGSLLDDSMKRALEAKLRKSSLCSRIFAPGGVLESTQAKIELGYLLHLIEKEYLEPAKSIARIRNLFAHNLRMDFTSTDKRFREALSILTLHSGLEVYPEIEPNEPCRFFVKKPECARDVFEVNLKVLLAVLARSFRTYLASRAPHRPEDLFRPESLAAELGLKAIQDAGARLDHLGRDLNLITGLMRRPSIIVRHRLATSCIGPGP